MIHTVTLNPAIDRTVTIEGFALDQVNRIAAARRDPGGKGINVSKVIRNLGGGSLAHALVGGEAGRYLQRAMESLSIATVFVPVIGETRTNLKVVDPVRGTHTDINEPGPLVEAAALRELEDGLFARLGKGDVLVLSGSVPQGVDAAVYGRWIRRAKATAARTLLDADGELLRAGAGAGPDLIKPNIHELERLVGRQLTSTDAIIAAARELVAKGVGMVVVSLGGDGALFVDATRAFRAEGIQVAAKSTVGAGDSMLAAIALALEAGKGLQDLVVPAVAAGTAAVTTEGSGACTREQVAVFAAQVKYQPV